MTEENIKKLIEKMIEESSEKAKFCIDSVRELGLSDWEQAALLRNYDRAHERCLVLEELLYRMKY